MKEASETLTNSTSTSAANWQKPISLSNLLDLCEKIKAKIKANKVDPTIWMNKNTSEILKRRYPMPTGSRAHKTLLDLARHAVGIEICIDDTLGDLVIESGAWVRLSEFEEGVPGYRKLVRHRCTIER
jgi:hypothetical protein